MDRSVPEASSARRCKPRAPGSTGTGPPSGAKISDLELSWSRERYDRAFIKVEDYIAAGDVYQINLTLKYRFAFEGDPVALYAALRRKQRVAYGALIHTPELDVLSLSPELFFRREGKHMSTRPMKGTAPRGRTPREDARLKTWLAMDEKQRAENLMIVDLLAQRSRPRRQDRLGRGDRPVHRRDLSLGAPDDLRHLGRAQSDMGLKDMLRALFPCGSVTGAPKVRAMEIISELEDGPRGIYTGAIGHIAPSGDAQFNVAHPHRRARPATRARWASAAASSPTSKVDSEFEECLLKAHFLTKVDAPFELIETLRYEPASGFHLLERHLARLQSSAAHFGYPFSREAVLAALDAEAARAAEPVALVRLLLGEDGAITVTSTAITLPTKDTVWRFVISDQRLDEKDPLFYHKTTRRQFYDREMERQKALTGCDEVVFLNMKGELTEGTRTTLFIELDGRLFTPALTCGLLPGTLREELLDLPRAAASEAVLTPQDLLGRRPHLSRQFGRGLVRAELMQPGQEKGLTREPAHASAGT